MNLQQPFLIPWMGLAAQPPGLAPAAPGQTPASPHHPSQQKMQVPPTSVAFSTASPLLTQLNYGAAAAYQPVVTAAAAHTAPLFYPITGFMPQTPGPTAHGPAGHGHGALLAQPASFLPPTASPKFVMPNNANGAKVRKD